MPDAAAEVWRFVRSASDSIQARTYANRGPIPGEPENHEIRNYFEIEVDFQEEPILVSNGDFCSLGSDRLEIRFTSDAEPPPPDTGFWKGLLHEATRHVERKTIFFDSIVALRGGGRRSNEHLQIRPPSKRHHPSNVINVGAMYGSNIQQDARDSKSSAAFGVETRDLGALLRKIEGASPTLGLSQFDEQQVKADVATAQAQLSSSRPKHSVIAECLHSIRTILEGAGAHALAVGLITELSRFIGR